MNVIVAAIVGFLAGRMLWLALRKSWHRPPLLAKNHQGVTLPTAAGVSIALSLVLVEAGRAVFGASGIGDKAGLTSMRAGTVVVVLGFTLLGLFDDLADATPRVGLAGHVKALLRGELTSGAMKMFGGMAIALVGAAFVSHGSLGSLILSAAIVALAANLANLLDVRPGRTIKVNVLVFVLLAIGTRLPTQLVPVALVVGAAAALVLDDLHERLMLGDAGASALGAAVGLGMAGSLGGNGKIVAFVAVLGLNFLNEVVSFSKIIDRVAPLRALDQIGRRKPLSTIDVRDDRMAGFATLGDDDMATSPFRSPGAPVQATVGGAHVGGSTGSQAGDQSQNPSNETRDRAATRPFSSREPFGSRDDDPFDRNGPRSSGGN